MRERLDWKVDGAGWPNAAFSRFVQTEGFVWHVQRAGQGPGLLLLHGTGASTHSWSGLLPLLAAQHEVLAMDLPGHGFTRNLKRLDASLPAMTRSIGELMAREAFQPICLIGHSAGAAIAATLAARLSPAPRSVIALNGALKPIGGAAGLIAPMMAKALAINPLAWRALARGGRDPARVSRLIESTGSHPGADYLANYGRLFANPAHVAGTLSMMANWDVHGVLPPLARAGIALHQIVGANDRAVSPEYAADLAHRNGGVTCETLPGLGHLAHEEDAPQVAAAIFAALGEAAPRRRRASR